jgi:threonine aldolase
MSGGTVYPIETVDEICTEAHNRGLKVHIDGARIFNAATACGASVSRIAGGADTVMFCLSKGLGAPVGSLLVGTAETIAEGRLLRKRLGGGMRQAGVLAAAGLLALEEAPARLHEDHSNARLLAERLSGIDGITIHPAGVQTNIVIFDIAGLSVSASDFSQSLASRGVLANGVGGTRVRMVTHCDVSRADCEQAIAAVTEVASAALAAPVC